MVDVLLIYPPYKWPNKSQPLGLAYIASVLEKYGFVVRIVDMDPLGMDFSSLKKEIVKIKPKVVGISFMTPQYGHVVSLFKMVKEIDSKIKTMAGGPHVSALPNEMLEIAELDYVVIGEGEETTRELVAYLTGSKERRLEAIKGIGYVKDNRFVLNEPRELIQDFNALPFPAWHLLPMEKYSVVNLGGERNLPVYPLLSSRGCPCYCTFCSSHVVFDRKFRKRSVNNLIAEVEFLNETYGAVQFDFVDDTVTVDKKRMEIFCDHLIFSKKNYLWMCNSRVNTVTKELLCKMYKAGCLRIDFGVESANLDILKNIKKRITLEQVIKAHRWAKEAGMIVSSFFMVGNLGETPEHIKNTARFVEELDTDYPSASLCTPFPGTELYELANSKGWIVERDWSKYDTSAFIGKDYKPVATNGTMSRKELLMAYYFLNSRFLKKKLQTKYGKNYLLNYRFYYNQILKRMNQVGVLQSLKTGLRLLGNRYMQ
jgi:radical SAM superfamily enzyme YgiQ (UPF0313 family)